MWEKIFGHETNKIFLGNMLQGERKTPSLLFYGPDGIGKKKLALEFARSFLCLDDPTDDYCQCRSCRAFNGKSHPDFIYVEGQGARHDILIEQIKDVEKKAVYAPVLSPYKVCLIDGADRMRVEAANSLLKLLEEPPTYWLFILIASEISQILPTIRSRLMAIRFEPLHREEAARVMNQQNIPQGDTLARLSDGSPGKALHLAKTEALMWRERALFVMEGIADPYLMACLARLEWLGDMDVDRTQTFLEMLLLILRDAMMIKEGSGLLLYNEDERERIASIFASTTLPALKKALLETERFYLGLNKGVNTRMIREALFLEIHTFLKE